VALAGVVLSGVGLSVRQVAEQQIDPGQHAADRGGFDVLYVLV
jgi:hypothetical protein